MSAHVCPWWLGYLLVNPLRKWMQDPQKILKPYIQANDQILEIGPGMGFFTLPMAELAGNNGKVVCVDIQEKMIAALNKRLKKASRNGNVETRVCTEDSLGVSDLKEKVDFALLFAVVHEVPQQEHLIAQVCETVKTGGILLVAEPKGHVSSKAFEATVALIEAHGLKLTERPAIWRSHTAVFCK